MATTDRLSFLSLHVLRERGAKGRVCESWRERECVCVYERAGERKDERVLRMKEKDRAWVSEWVLEREKGRERERELLESWERV